MLFSMSQSLSCVLIHVVFSTKDRAPILHHSLRPALNGYLATVARSDSCPLSISSTCGSKRKESGFSQSRRNVK
jgi:hypothetical protein